MQSMALHLFEFMDHAWTPAILRKTLLDVLDFCNCDFRPWYRLLADDLLRTALAEGAECVAEPGAGAAPILRELALLIRSTPPGPAHNLQLIPSDLYPVPDVWRSLQREFPNIRPIYEPVDMFGKQNWPPRTLLLLAAALHHIPRNRRIQLLQNLLETADCVVVHEPVRRTAVSMLLTSFCWFPALLTPAARIRRSGSLRRILLCWLIPVVPLMFVWDGLVSCLRQWTDAEWENARQELGRKGIGVHRQTTMHSERITIRREHCQASDWGTGVTRSPAMAGF
jgi:hypothetical protein